jgi:hypothetical protein
VETVPGCELAMVPLPGADQRTYKADFGKFTRTFPNFEFLWTVRKGAQELHQAFRSIGLTHGHYTDKRFTRLQWLHHLLDTGSVDGSLRWRVKAAG